MQNVRQLLVRIRIAYLNFYFGHFRWNGILHDSVCGGNTDFYGLNPKLVKHSLLLQNRCHKFPEKKLKLSRIVREHLVPEAFKILTF